MSSQATKGHGRTLNADYQDIYKAFFPTEIKKGANERLITLPKGATNVIIKENKETSTTNWISSFPGGKKHSQTYHKDNFYRHHFKVFENFTEQNQ